MSIRKEFVAVLMRGINIGGRRIKMTELRDVLNASGFDFVQTIVQTGNVIVNLEANQEECKGNDTTANLVTRIVENHFGIHSYCVQRSLDELKDLVDNNPFISQTSDNKQLHVVFSKTERDSNLLCDKLSTYDFGEEQFCQFQNHVYLYLPHGMSGGALGNVITRFCQDYDTVRNWNTTCKILDALISLTSR